MTGEAWNFTDLMKRVLTVLVNHESALTALEIAAIMNLDLPNDTPMVGSATIISPLMRLRKMRLARRFMYKTGENRSFTRFGQPVDYPIFRKTYSVAEGKRELAKTILEYLGNDQSVLSANELNGIKYMLTQNKDAAPEPENPQAQLYALAMKETKLRQDDAEPYIEHHDPFFKWSKIWNKTKDAPYMLRVWIGRLRLHIFYRGDLDPDCHDHPWDFKTFPFTSYVEYVEVDPSHDGQSPQGFYNVVPAWRWTHRKAEHRHRVIGRYAGHMELAAHKDPLKRVHQLNIPADEASRFIRDHPKWTPAVSEGKIVTLVWRGRYRRMWGFWKSRLGKWCWINYRKYIWEGGKDAPCNDD